MKEVFEYALQGRISSRSNYARRKVPFCKTNIGQRCISYVGPSVWKKSPRSINTNTTLNTFKHDVKKHYVQELRM